MEADYETLKLKPGASLEEVKTAYRRLARLYHPDSAGPMGGDPVRFQEIYKAYQALSGRPGPGKRDDLETTVRSNSGHGEELWRLEEVVDLGPDVIYVLRVKAEGRRLGMTLNLPWFHEAACPRCLGAGHTLTPMFGGPHLSKTPCLKCQAKGVIIQKATLLLNVAPAEIKEGLVRFRGLGHYQPIGAARGDLILKIKPDWRDSFFRPVFRGNDNEAAE